MLIEIDPNSGITDIPGILVGHADDPKVLTGCTVVLCPDGAVGGIDRRGGGTSTRQADGFEPWHVVEHVHGVLLTGGSAHGLAASSGVLGYLEERGIGLGVGPWKVPIVGSAVIFDLGIGDGSVRPGPEMGRAACLSASALRPRSGCVGAGMGATVGKSLGPAYMTKSGIGTASIRIGTTDLLVGAIVAVNAMGDVVDPSSGRIVAGARKEAGGYSDALENLARWAESGYQRPGQSENTVIGVVATNARLNKQEATKVAQMAQDGLARTIRPAHTMFDGDTIFTMATGKVTAPVSVVGAFAAEVFAQAVLDAVMAANGIGGVPAVGEL